MASPLDALGGFDAVGAAGMAGQAIQAVIILIVLGVVTFAVLKLKIFYKFPISFDIFQLKGGVLQLVETDSGRRVTKKKDKEMYIDVKRRNFRWYPPSYLAQTMMKGGKKSKIYVLELSHNEWQVIDPSKFIRAKPEDYKRLEQEAVVRFWKNTEDAKADVKWKKEDKWKQIMDVLPTVIMFVGIGIFLYFFGTYVITPVMATFGGVTTQGIAMLEKSSELLERSTQYVELLLKLQGIDYTLPIPNASVIT